MTYSYSNLNYGEPAVNNNSAFYQKVMVWVTAAMGAVAFGSLFIGPLVPPALMLPLYVVVLIALIVASFSRRTLNPTFSNVFAIAVPALLGIILYPTLNYYLSSGMGNIVSMAAMGTVVIFGGMAVLGWVSQVNLNRWMPKLFFILLGVIVLSILNVLFFKLTLISLLISMAVVVIMAIYTFIDIQMLRDCNPHDNIPASFYALNLFLNIYNIFVNLLNILGILRN